MGRPPKYTDEHKQEIIYLQKQYPSMTQEEIASSVGCSQAYVSQVLNTHKTIINNSEKNQEAGSIIELIRQNMNILNKHIHHLGKQPTTVQTTRALAYANKIFNDYAMQLKEYTEQREANWHNFLLRIKSERPELYGTMKKLFDSYNLNKQSTKIKHPHIHQPPPEEQQTEDDDFDQQETKEEG